MNYFSTFIVGTENIVSKILKHHIDDVEIVDMANGLIRYKTDISVDKLKTIPCFNNTFLELFRFDVKQNKTLTDITKEIIKSQEWINFPSRYIIKNKSFRVFFSDKNQTVAIDKEVHEAIEALIHEKLSLNKNRQHPDYEFWLFKRSEGFASWSLRLTYRPETKSFLQKGELRPELAYIMNYLSEPSKQDVYLDPFAGTGRLALERIKYGEYKRIYVTDNDPEVVKKLKRVSKLPMDKFVAWKVNAKDLSEFGKASINKIVTDPPWGDFKETVDIQGLYSEFIKSSERILADKGILILLTSKQEIVEEIVKSIPNLKIRQKYNILVSGHKSTLMKIVKSEK